MIENEHTMTMCVFFLNKIIKFSRFLQKSVPFFLINFNNPEQKENGFKNSNEN